MIFESEDVILSKKVDGKVVFEHFMILYRDCPKCGKAQRVKVYEKDMDTYRKTLDHRKSFPYLTDDDFRVFEDGLCEKCR